MKRLLCMDEHNYDTGLKEIYRIAVRGIIFSDGKLVLNESSAGELKLPGGGQEHGENDMQTLIREVQEETGFTVIPESVKAFGYIEEKRLSVSNPMIWHQINRLFFCDVHPKQGACAYTENEKLCGFHPRLYTLEEAIMKSERLLQSAGKQAWNQREYNTLLLIKDFLAPT